MKKITYSVGVLTMSVLVSYSFSAYATEYWDPNHIGDQPPSNAKIHTDVSKLSNNNTTNRTPPKTGMHADLGLQGNVEFSSIKYDDSSLSYNHITSLFSNSMPIKGKKTSVTPSVFIGMRYYLPRNMFLGIHIGDIPMNKQIFDHNYPSSRIPPAALYEVNTTLTRLNSLYSRFSFGYFVLPDTDININILISWDLYKLKYTRDGYDYAYKTYRGNLTKNEHFNWWGYGFGIAVDHYFTSHLIASLGYNFVLHNSKNQTIDSFTGSHGDVYFTSPAPIKLSNMHEHIVSLALMYEI